MSADPTTATNGRRSGLGYLPGLDGLRALSVALVFLFHAQVIDGGFIGVDVFFVISGFLITGLALDEIERTGRLALASFWGRRARRLLPALFLLVAGVVLWSAIDKPAPEALGREVVSTLLYVANWSRVGSGDEYFAAYQNPSLLEHTWSLAVEEQFYVVWPLIIVAVVWIAARRGWAARRVIGAVAAVAAVSSTAWTWALANDGTTQLNRLYFGTDTRAVGLAVGCVAACVLARGTNTATRRIGTAEVALAALSAGALLVLSVVLDGSERWLYGPGFALVALASISVTLAAAGDGVIARWLGVRPLAQMGRVSYGIYLWHWPVIVVLNAERTGLSGPALGALWVSATAALTATSWFLVERRAPLPTIEFPSRSVAYTGIGALLGIGAIVTTNVGGVEEPATLALPQEIAEGTVVTTSPDVTTAENITTDDTDTPTSTDATTSTDPATATATTLPAPTDRPLRVLLLGDSVAESMKAAPASLTSVGDIEVSIVNRSIVACPVMWEGRWVFDDGRIIEDPAGCDDPDRFAQDVAEVDPDLIVMMFAWGGTISGRELTDGSVAAACDPAFDTAFGDAFDTLVDRFDDDARVIVTNTARPTEFRSEAQSGRPACLNAEIERRDLDVFDFNEWLCPAGDCSPAVPLMRDTVHFADSDDVRSLIWPALMDEFLTTAGYLDTP